MKGIGVGWVEPRFTSLEANVGFHSLDKLELWDETQQILGQYGAGYAIQPNLV